MKILYTEYAIEGDSTQFQMSLLIKVRFGKLNVFQYRQWNVHQVDSNWDASS